MGKSKKKKKQLKPAKKLSPPQPERISYVYDVTPITDDERDAWLLFESHIFSQTSFDCLFPKENNALIKQVWGTNYDFAELLGVFTTVIARYQDEEYDYDDESDAHAPDMSDVEVKAMQTFLTISRDILILESCHRLGSGVLHYSKALSALLKFWKIKKPVGTLLMRYLADNGFYERTAARYTIYLPAFTQSRWPIVQSKLLTNVLFAAVRGEPSARIYVAQNLPMMTALFTEKESAEYFSRQVQLLVSGTETYQTTHSVNG
ncbi:MAG: hypothetical protein EOO38_00140 [Cytophagaceae bacterium]|nr:MAG: hypothetical protein EOO38_00140 [Cytophagaceae bacterium]